MSQKAVLTIRCSSCFGTVSCVGVVADTMDGPVEEMGIKQCPRCGVDIYRATLDKMPALAEVTSVLGPV